MECGWILPFQEICIVCDRPIRISFDTKKCLYAEGEPALEFLDGLRVYAHHRVKLPKQYGILLPNQWKAQWYQVANLTISNWVFLAHNLENAVYTQT
ncbi:DUF6745 domain-containing protein [Nostoc sp.]|uniref:DUF6745 domain-containing protein n=1 Tax=Nostoc sp. TaxID=1180 RepID=UPI00359390DF